MVPENNSYKKVEFINAITCSNERFNYHILRSVYPVEPESKVNLDKLKAPLKRLFS